MRPWEQVIYVMSDWVVFMIGVMEDSLEMQLVYPACAVSGSHRASPELLLLSLSVKRPGALWAFQGLVGVYQHMFNFDHVTRRTIRQAAWLHVQFMFHFLFPGRFHINTMKNMAFC